MSGSVAVGVAGLGPWGSKLADALDGLPETELRWLCDLHAERQLRVAARYPAARTTSDLDDLLEDGRLDAVVIATPPATHFELARRVLLADKHAFVQDPLASTAEEADELVRLGERRRRRLIVGQLSLFHPAVRKLRELTEIGRLGRIHYLYGTTNDRVALGGADGPVHFVRDDIAVVLYLVGEYPLEVWARGDSYDEAEKVDVLHCQLTFPRGLAAYLHLSRLDARRNRRLVVVGSKATAVLAQRDSGFSLTIHDATGDVIRPFLPGEDTHRLACDYFVSTIRSPETEVVGAREGAAVVHVLEALRRALEADELPRRPVGGDAPGAQVLQLPLQRSS